MSSREPKAPPIASLLQDRFDFVEFLGKGGFASVYKVRRISLARTEALKVLVGKHSEDVEFGRRFQQEARVAASLEHPNIVHIYDFGDAQGTYWYSMQFVDGPTVTSEMKAKGPLSEETAAKLAVSLLDALDYSHDRGVVHRDIKPDNLILDKRGHPYLMDFGIAKSADSMVETQTGFVLGSPAYLSPEQLRGEPLDGRTDVYSFGITLYEMLSGGRPFDATDRTELMIQRLRQDPIPIARLRPGISDEMAEIVMKSLARERGQRFSGAAEMRDALSALLADRTSPTSSLSSSAMSSTSTRGRRGEGERSGSVPAPGGEPETIQATSLLPVPTSSTVRRRPATTTETSAQTRSENQHPSRTPPPLREDTSLGSEAIPEPAFAAVPNRRRWGPALVGLLVLGGIAAIWWTAKRERPGLDRPVRAQPTAPLASPATPAVAPSTTFPMKESPQVAPIQTVRPEPTIVEPEATPALVERTRPPAARPVEKRAAAVPERTKPPRDTSGDVVVRRQARTPPEEEFAEPVKLRPDLAREYAGKRVGFSVTIAADGSVKEARVISKVSPQCDECDKAALEAMKLYRFRPARDADGAPLESRVSVSVSF